MSLKKIEQNAFAPASALKPIVGTLSWVAVVTAGILLTGANAILTKPLTALRKSIRRTVVRNGVTYVARQSMFYCTAYDSKVRGLVSYSAWGWMLTDQCGNVILSGFNAANREPSGATGPEFKTLASLKAAVADKTNQQWAGGLKAIA